MQFFLLTKNLRKVIDETCEGDPSVNSDETDIADKISWNCENGTGPGATCQKICGTGTRPSGHKQTKTCECTGSCQWKGATASCVPAVCKE